MRTERRNQRGFTLIEVIVVIAVLGILTGTVLLAVGNQGSQSAVTACKADAKSVQTALEEYRSDNNGAYPSSGGTYPFGPSSTSPNDPAWKLLLQPQTGFAGSPFMRDMPPTSNYVVWWEVDPNGLAHVYVDSGQTTLPFTYPTSSNGLLANMDFIATGGVACDTYAH